MSSPLLLGHRGARASVSVAENTLASFDLALDHGCNGFEFDVRLTTDGCGVVCHDPQVGRKTIARTKCAQLPQLPRLQDVLARYADRAFLDIELKVPGVESQLLVALREHVPEKGYVVSSFLPEILTELRLRSPEVALGFLSDRRQNLDQWRKLPVEYVIPHHSLVTQKLVEDVHAAGRVIFVWTVNDKRSMLRLADWGVDGIVSDETELLVKTLH